ncbi:MAG: rod shape-determining protein MreD [Blastomonas sp.]
MKQPYKARLNQEVSPLRLAGIPIATVVLGSMTTILPFVTSAPLLPPFGLLVLIAWMMLRPGLWPVWAGVPFGLVDDVFSGQPIGSAVLLWSVILIAMDIIEQRYVWRNHWQDWLIAAAFIIFALLAGLAINNSLTAHNATIITILPQLIISLAIFPLVLRLVARLDRLRLKR